MTDLSYQCDVTKHRLGVTGWHSALLSWHKLAPQSTGQREAGRPYLSFKDSKETPLVFLSVSSSCIEARKILGGQTRQKNPQECPIRFPGGILRTGSGEEVRGRKGCHVISVQGQGREERCWDKRLMS